MAIEWKDISTYGQWVKKEDRVPHLWQTKLGNVAVLVYRHIHVPGVWLLKAQDMGVSMVELENKELAEAQKEALEIVRESAKGHIKEMEEVLKNIGE